MKKKRGAVIVDAANFIEVSMKVNSVSSDSILVNVSIFNKKNDTFLVYKPLLPGLLSEEIFTVLNIPGYDKVKYTKQKKKTTTIRRVKFLTT